MNDVVATEAVDIAKEKGLGSIADSRGDVVKLLDEYSEKLDILTACHVAASRRFKKRMVIMQLALKLMPLLSASGYLPEFMSANNSGIILVLSFIVTIFNGVTSVINDSMQYEQRYVKHTTAYLNYGELSRQISYFKASADHKNTDIDGFWLLVEHKYLTYDKMAPDIPSDIEAKVNREMGVVEQRDKIKQTALVCQANEMIHHISNKKKKRPPLEKLMDMDTEELRDILRDQTARRGFHSHRSKPRRISDERKVSSLSDHRSTTLSRTVHASKTEILESLLFDHDLLAMNIAKYDKDPLKFKNNRDEAVEQLAVEVGLV